MFHRWGHLVHVKRKEGIDRRMNNQRLQIFWSKLIFDFYYLFWCTLWRWLEVVFNILHIKFINCYRTFNSIISSRLSYEKCLKREISLWYWSLFTLNSVHRYNAKIVLHFDIFCDYLIIICQLFTSWIQIYRPKHNILSLYFRVIFIILTSGYLIILIRIF